MQMILCTFKRRMSVAYAIATDYHAFRCSDEAKYSGQLQGNFPLIHAGSENL